MALRNFVDLNFAKQRVIGKAIEKPQQFMNLKLPNILILCFFTLASYAQKPVGEFSQNERRNLLTVTNAISSLKGIETPSIKL